MSVRHDTDPAPNGAPGALSKSDIDLLAVMLRDKEAFFSAPRLQTTTMVMRRLTESGVVTMSLSKAGLPHYQITPAGEAAVIEAW